MMQVEIRVDRGRCIGSGQCVFVAGGVFDQDQEAKAIVTDPRGEPEEKVVHAVTACPVQAISLSINGTEVEADDLKDWVHGIRSRDPVVPLLEELSHEHHELRVAFAASTADAEVCEQTRTHLRHEAAAYSAIAALVDPRLVAAFESEHDAIEHALGGLTAAPADPVQRLEARARLSRAMADHIQLEETVLFPVALASLARR